MGKSIVSVMRAAVLLLPVFCLRADTHDVAQVTNHVVRGATVAFDGGTILSERTTVIKTGEGELTVAAEDSRVPALNVQVREGTVAYENAKAAPAPSDLSAGVRAKLGLWVSASDATHLVTNGNEVSYWYDCRESDTAQPQYAYLKTIAADGAKSPTLTMAQYVSCTGTRTETKKAVWFGGFDSGAAMDVLNPDGTPFSGRPQEFSTAYGYIDVSKSIGIIFGNSKSQAGNTLYYCQINGLPWRSAWGPAAGDTRIWLDGKTIDRGTELLPLGFHALHTRINTLTGDATPAGVFNLALFSQNDTASGRGGEYLSEVMIFTNRLTHAERQEVQRYISLKWFADRRSTMGVVLESGAELDATVAAGETTTNDLRVTGSGAFVKKGDGTFIYCPADLKAAPTAAVTIEGGSVETRRALAVRASAGQKITAALPSELIGETVSVGSADTQDTVVKDGPGVATIAAIPSEAKKLSVTEGVLALRPVRTVKRYEVAIPNGDFSDWGGDASGNVKANYGGWTSYRDAIFYNRARWIASGTGTGLPYGMGTFGLSELPPHPEGENGLMLRNAGMDWAKVDIAFPESGEYELSYMICGGSYLARIRNYLTDANDVESYIGEAAYRPAQKTSWEQRTFRFSVATAGTYTLHFDLDEHLYQGSKMDEAVTINGLHLYRVGDNARAYKIPGGDFERLESNDGGWTYLPTIGYVSMDYTVAGWTFDSTVERSYPRSGLVCYYTMAEGGRRWGSGFNVSHRPFGGEYQLLIRANGGTAQATFTPPAGRWYLQATMAHWGDYDGAPQISATVDATSLGTVAIPKTWTMVPRTWPDSFVADGQTPVTLTVTYSGPSGVCGVHLDDFMLVGEYRYDDELVQNGDFEADRWAANPYKHWNVFGACDHYSRAYGANEASEMGFDHASGQYYIEPYYSPTDKGCPGGFYQDVTFPNRGWYRLTYLTRGRVWASHTRHPIDALLIDTASSATNLIDRFEVLPRGTFCQQTALFHVDAACVRRVLFVVREPSYDNPAFDDISIRYVGEDGSAGVAGPTDDFGDLRVDVAVDGCLKLDYAGTNTVRRFSVNGVRYPYGVVNASNCPQILGPGTLLVSPGSRGLMLLMR